VIKENQLVKSGETITLLERHIQGAVKRVPSVS
jgi:hypothetical protein